MAVNNLIEIKNLSIVLVGNFNPSIVQPHWLANKGLIREEEANEAKIDLIHNEYACFNLGWAKLEVWLDKFAVSTTQEPYFEIIRDLCVGIFATLKETPVTAVGINTTSHLRTLTKKQYSEFGDKLVPLANWDFLNNPRVRTIEMLDNEIAERNGYRRIIIQPSDKLSDTIMFNINDHYNFEDKTAINNQLTNLFNNHWHTSLKESDSIIEKLWGKVNLDN